MSGAPWPALLAVAAALVAWPPANARTVVRARELARRARRRPVRVVAIARRRWLFAAGAGLAVLLLVGGLPGLTAGTVAAVVTERLLRSSSSSSAARDAAAALQRGLPAACDLLGVVLSAGVPVGTALSAVAGVVGEPLAGELRSVAGLYRLGAEPRGAWAGAPAGLAALGRVLVRAGESGSGVAPALRALAADGRAAERARVEADVRRAGVWVLAPLGLCFLPAFVCLGIVPLVLGIAGEVFR
jgi:pilus assembly protein TadC